MLPRRYSIRALFVVMTLVALMLALRPRPFGVTQAQYDLLKKGMKQSEFEALLDGSPRNSVKSAMVWVPQKNGTKISVKIDFRSPRANFFPDVTKDAGYQALWLTETGLIAACFGPDERLQKKYFSTVRVIRTPTIVDWLASRPRMIRQSLGL